MYGQNWGTVYDTINYTTTGALGDWFDSRVGLNADGIDNEMSFSHLDSNITFEPTTEQLHVDGNKGLIYAHLAEILGRRTRGFTSKGRKGYVPLARVKRKAKRVEPARRPARRRRRTSTRSSRRRAPTRRSTTSRSSATRRPTTAACASR